jgi:hypothetical protein
MATLSITQMYALARSAGLSSARAVVAAAVGMAESSGRTAITSNNPDGGTNVGVWQLDTKGVGAGYTVAQLQDPQTNAKVMAKGSKNGEDWGPWETFATGAYTKFLPGAEQASEAEQTSSGGGPNWLKIILNGIAGGGAGAAAAEGNNPVGSLLQLPSQITGLFSALEAPVQAAMWLFQPTNWARVFAGVLGFLLLGAGLITLGLAA